MEYTTLGDTGLEVSRIGLGCMSFGSEDSWMLPREEAIDVIESAIDHGINYFDTANLYSEGESESILGEAIAGYERDELVVSTKSFFPRDDSAPNRAGLSRKTIVQELNQSLSNLGLDAVDVHICHRWDYDTDIRHTLEALAHVTRQGKAHYLGASSMYAYQLATACRVSERRNLPTFSVMQNHYNVAYREEEREMLPLCELEGIGVTPWGPLAQGFLSRPCRRFRDTTRNDPGNRHVPKGVYKQGNGVEINERVEELAEEKGVSMAQISLSWLLHKPWVDSPIVGVSSPQHLEEAVAAVNVDLSESDLQYLEEPYRPVQLVGNYDFMGWGPGRDSRRPVNVDQHRFTEE